MRSVVVSSIGARGQHEARGRRRSDVRATTRSAAGRVMQQRPLPLFPVQPIGVFLPGMTKTLHLYEDHFKSLIEEALAGEEKLFSTAVLEPNSSESRGSPSPGSYVGGHNFMLSCACLCKILSAKPYPGGYLVRIRGEARLGITGLEQVEPYMRASAFPMADAPVMPHDLPVLMAHLNKLQGIMRDVQNLASKFRCDETACVQQAMYWVNQDSLFSAVMRLPSLSSEGTGTLGHSDSTERAERSSIEDRASEEAEEEEEDVVELASRLSFASFQWLPQSTQEEKIAVLRGRMLAMETFSVIDRLSIACDVMGEQRDSLMAKCALKTAER